MFKGLGMAMAMLAAMGGQSISRAKPGQFGYAPPQSDDSKKYFLDRAAMKRARKAEKLKAQAND